MVSCRIAGLTLSGWHVMAITACYSQPHRSACASRHLLLGGVSHLIAVCNDQKAQIKLLTEAEQVVRLSTVPLRIPGYHILPLLIIILVHLGLPSTASTVR